MDCHALQGKARNDKKKQWIASVALLSRNDKGADFSHETRLSSSRILGVAVVLSKVDSNDDALSVIASGACTAWRSTLESTFLLWVTKEATLCHDFLAEVSQ